MPAAKPSIADIVKDFNNDFTNRNLDAVMEYFAPNAEFKNLDGKTAKGIHSIRNAFKPLFKGAYGQVEFLEKSLIIDEENKQASFVWNCQHNLASKQKLSMTDRSVFGILKLINGSAFYWEGIDYFKFDENNKIVSKQTYGKSKFPMFIRGFYKS